MDKKAKDIKKEIVIHLADGDGSILNIHTHGLDKYDHCEFQTFAHSLYIDSASRLLNVLSDAVINKKTKFVNGDSLDWSEWGKFLLKEKEKGILTIVPYYVSLEEKRRK